MEKINIPGLILLVVLATAMLVWQWILWNKQTIDTDEERWRREHEEDDAQARDWHEQMHDERPR